MEAFRPVLSKTRFQRDRRRRPPSWMLALSETGRRRGPRAAPRKSPLTNSAE